MHPERPSSTSLNFQPHPDNGEVEIRRQLTERVVAESVGSVGLYTSADFDSDEQAAIAAALQERNPGRQPDRRLRQGGFGNYGEREIYEQSDPLAASLYGLDVNHEELHAQDLPDGAVDFRYGFTSNGMRDGTGRPGNRLVMGFSLPAESARALMAAVEADPSLINDVVKQQALACGVPEKFWDRQMAPRYGINDWRDDKDRELTVFRHDAQAEVTAQERLRYSDQRPLKQALETALGAPAAAEAGTEHHEPLSYTKYRKEAQQQVKDFHEAGPVYTLGNLAGIKLEYNQRLTQLLRTDGDYDEAAGDEMFDAVGAYGEVYNDFLQSQYETAGPQFLENYTRQVAEMYYQAIDEVERATQKDPLLEDPKMETEVTIPGMCIYELQSIEEALGVLEPRPDKGLVKRIVGQVMAESKTGDL